MMKQIMMQKSYKSKPDHPKLLIDNILYRISTLMNIRVFNFMIFSKTFLKIHYTCTFVQGQI